MKRLIMACLLAASSHGWAADLDPKCHELYSEMLAAQSLNEVGTLAVHMFDNMCWPALQNPSSDNGASGTAIPMATDCQGLVPHIVALVNNQNSAKILKVYDAKPMTYETIDRVADGHDIFITITDNQGRSARGHQSLKYDDKTYIRGKGHYTGQSTVVGYDDDGYMITDTPTYGDKGVVLVPNSEPFTGDPPTGTRRILDCSAEARYTDGMWLIQMYLDRDSEGEEFFGMTALMELR